MDVVEAGDLIETDPSTHTDVDRALFDKLPLERSTSSLSSLVTLASPGVTSDSNGLFHGLGDHASNSFSVDGEPITDQQSKVFSNQLPSDAVQSMEVIEGAPPAEYGDKTSLVIVATTRSGLGATEPHGDFTTSYGSFNTLNEAGDLTYGGKSWGNFISLNGSNTNRFLDTPEFTIMHDHGNQENLFDRADFKPSVADTVTLNFSYTRSWFQTPNSFDAQNATAWSGPVCINFIWLIRPHATGWARTVRWSARRTSAPRSGLTTSRPASRIWSTAIPFSLSEPSPGRTSTITIPAAILSSSLTPDLQRQTVGQNRRLTDLGLRSNVSYVKGAHNIKVGANFTDTILTENDNLGLIDPTLNAVCLTAALARPTPALR